MLDLRNFYRPLPLVALLLAAPAFAQDSLADTRDVQISGPCSVQILTGYGSIDIKDKSWGTVSTLYPKDQPTVLKGAGHYDFTFVPQDALNGNYWEFWVLFTPKNGSSRYKVHLKYVTAFIGERGLVKDLLATPPWRA